jgi:hypothetical protein
VLEVYEQLSAYTNRLCKQKQNKTSRLMLYGRAIAQAVSRWLPTAAARVRPRVWSSGICGGQSGGGAGIL